MSKISTTDIVIMRKSSFFGYFARAKIFIDGREETRVKNGETVQISVENGDHTIMLGKNGDIIPFTAKGEGIMFVVEMQNNKFVFTSESDFIRKNLSEPPPPATTASRIKYFVSMILINIVARRLLPRIIASALTALGIGTTVAVVAEKSVEQTATCGERSYEVEHKFCYKGELYYKCGRENYNPDLQFCYNSAIGERKSPVYGTFTDRRDKKTYKTVKIGGQTWMAENLNYAAEGSVCYNNIESNCATYGRLYDWVTAMDEKEKCYYKDCKYKIVSRGVCPKGWHVPSIFDFTALEEFVNGIDGMVHHEFLAYLPTAKRFMSADGFAAKFGGYATSDNNFDSTGVAGYWWTTSAYAITATCIGINNERENAYTNESQKTYLYSVRCMMD